MPRKPSGGVVGRPVSESTVQRIAKAKYRQVVSDLMDMAMALPPPPPPTPEETPEDWVRRVQEYAGMVTNIRYDIAMLKMADTNPKDFMARVAKTIEVYRPKLARTEVKSEINIKQSTFVPVEHREEPPIDLVQLENGSFGPPPYVAGEPLVTSTGNGS